MNKNIILDTNILLFLYSNDNFGANWTAKQINSLTDILSDKNYLFELRTPVILEYLKVLYTQYLESNNLRYFKAKKTGSYMSQYNKGVSFINLLIEKNNFIFTGDINYNKIKNFYIDDNHEVVDDFLIKNEHKVLSMDKEVYKSKNSIYDFSI